LFTQMGCPRTFDNFTKDFYNFRDSFDVGCLKFSNSLRVFTVTLNEEAALQRDRTSYVSSYGVIVRVWHELLQASQIVPPDREMNQDKLTRGRAIASPSQSKEMCHCKTLPRVCALAG